MRELLDVGAACEFKVGNGLGGWRPGTVIAVVDGEYAVKTSRGEQFHALARKHVRAPKSPRPAPRRVAPLPSPPPALERKPVSVVRPSIEAVHRAAPVRSPAYLDWVREHPCCACGAAGPSDPHHYGRHGVGTKTDDLRTVPLCREDHDAFHRTRCVRGKSPRETHVLFVSTMVELLVGWLRRDVLLDARRST